MIAVKKSSSPNRVVVALIVNSEEVGQLFVERLENGEVQSKLNCSKDYWHDVLIWWDSRKTKAKDLLDGLPIEEF